LTPRSPSGELADRSSKSFRPALISSSSILSS
jgi:hypothetical protein